MTTTQNLTPAAKRDLAILRAGGTVRFRYGPLQQLIAAGFVNDDGNLLADADALDEDEQANLARLRARYAS